MQDYDQEATKLDAACCRVHKHMPPGSRVRGGDVWKLGKYVSTRSVLLHHVKD